MRPHISVKDLSVQYGALTILNHISIDIPDKKITAIIGPSGCGKTTLLKSFNRLLDLQEGAKVSGQVLVDGEDIYDPGTEMTHLRRRMGLLSQKPTVLPMSIYENVVYGLRIHGEKNKSKLDQAVEKYLREANLWNEVKDRLHDSASRLSIGQQQRLCLARGLAVEPEIILGDEPTSALDPVSAEQIEQRFLALKNQYTIVLVTHILRQAKRLADYVIFLYLGNLIEHGPAEKVLSSPRFVKTQAYLEGRFIEEFPIAAELDLCGGAKQDFPFRFEESLRGLTEGQIFKTLVDNEGLLRQILDLEQGQGHKVLEVRQISSTQWEIIIEKRGIGYSI